MNVGNKLKLAKNFATSKVARQILKGQKHSPEILFVVGTAGVIASTVMACRATLKYEELVEPFHNKTYQAKDYYDTSPDVVYDEKALRHDIVVIKTRQALAVSKLYGPSLTVGALAICALGGSHVILTKRNGALIAAYAALDKGFSEYRGRVSEFVGKDQERELRYPSEEREIVTEGKNGPEVSVVKSATEGAETLYARFFDEKCSSWQPRSEYNLLFLRCQQNYANDLLKSRGHVFLNEVYDMLGIERTKAGAMVGWVVGGDKSDNYIDFGLYDDTNPRARDFVNGRERSVLLDFNVDGIIYDQI